MRNYYKTNSHYLTYTLSLKNVGRMYVLSLGVKGLNAFVRNVSCALGNQGLHSRENFISTFTELHVHGNKR